VIVLDSDFYKYKYKCKLIVGNMGSGGTLLFPCCDLDCDLLWNWWVRSVWVMN